MRVCQGSILFRFVLFCPHLCIKRLSFGLAIERAQQEGISCAMVIVGDDVSLPNLTQPRGIAGTLFVHKIAGFFAHVRKVDLETLHKHASTVAGSIRSIGVAWTECSLPGGRRTESRFQSAGAAELGMGIHGEPGARQVSLNPAIVSDMLASLKLEPGHRYALLVNNLGGASVLEMQCVVHAILEACPEEIALISSGHLMTSLDMHGFSCSVLDLSILPADYEEALRHPVSCPAWKPMVSPRRRPALVQVPQTAAPPPRLGTKNHGEQPPPLNDLKAAVQRVCTRLLMMEQELNDLDRIVGDGDTGSSIASGCRAVLKDLPTEQMDYLSVFQHLSRILARSMGGSSGVLLSIFFAGAANHVAAAPSNGSLFDACAAGVQKMMFYGGAKEGDRTVLDAMIPAFFHNELSSAVQAARKGRDATAHMSVARAGRSQYVPTLNGTMDPGAVAFVSALEALQEEK